MERIDLGKCNRRIKGFYPWVPVKNKSVEIYCKSDWLPRHVKLYQKVPSAVWLHTCTIAYE